MLATQCTDDIVAVSKGGVPVHSSGRYRRNTLVHILGTDEFGLPGLLPVHRLDRVTTGVCLLARNKAAARTLADQIAKKSQAHSRSGPLRQTQKSDANTTKCRGAATTDDPSPILSVRKEYIAMVQGLFPPGEQRCDLPLSLNAKTRRAFVDKSSAGKAATTLFRRLATGRSTKRCATQDGRAESARTSSTTSGWSIVLALPQTGRTHQIRIHLQALGHPIVDDPVYTTASMSLPKVVNNTGRGEEPPEKKRLCKATLPHETPSNKPRLVSDHHLDNLCCAHCPYWEPVDAYVFLVNA